MEDTVNSPIGTGTRFRLSIGFIGPIYYFILLFYLGSVWEGYSPLHQSMSEIGAVDSPYRHSMNFLGFSALGLFMLVYAYNFYDYFGSESLDKIVTGLIVIGGIFLFSVGFLPCDAGCIDVTTTGHLHSITSSIAAIALSSSCILSATPVTNKFNARWGWLAFILGIVSMSSGLFLWFPFSESYIGLIQRIGIGTSMLWIVIISIKMYAIYGQE